MSLKKKKNKKVKDEKAGSANVAPAVNAEDEEKDLE